MINHYEIIVNKKCGIYAKCLSRSPHHFNMLRRKIFFYDNAKILEATISEYFKKEYDKGPVF